MNAKSKLLELTGNYLNTLGEKERKNDGFAICPVIGYQPQRPYKADEKKDAAKD